MRAREFISKLLPGGGLSRVLRYWDRLGIQHRVSELDDIIRVHEFVVPDDRRGSGVGSRAMRRLFDYADRVGYTVVLTPTHDLGASSLERLERFYRDLGFVYNRGGDADPRFQDVMYREPSGL